jgi:hypothetical protein
MVSSEKAKRFYHRGTGKFKKNKVHFFVSSVFALGQAINKLTRYPKATSRIIMTEKPTMVDIVTRSIFW